MGFVTVDFEVWLNGQNVTSRLDPLLKSVDIDRNAGQASDECTLTLSDADGRIKLPGERATVLINIRGNQAFKGFVSDVSFELSKGGGRELQVSASSVDRGGKAKQPTLKHLDEASFQDAASTFGKIAGLTVVVAGTITNVVRPYWLMQSESFMSWGHRIASEIGSSFKIIGDTAYFVGINEGISTSGKVLTPISGVVGDNLISCSISPIMSRPKFKDVELSYFDVKKGEKVKVKVPTGIDDVDAALRSVITSANEAQAKQTAGAHGKKSEREKGGGSATILGDELAEPEAIFNLSGARTGIDGAYRISSVKHSLSKKGFTTELTLKQPQGTAGVDNR